MKVKDVKILSKLLKLWLIYVVVTGIYLVRLVYSLFSISIPNPFAVSLILLLGFLSISLLARAIKNQQLSKKEKEFRSLAAIFTVIWITLLVFVVFSVESEYAILKKELTPVYYKELETNKSKINATWAIVDRYFSEFNGKYGKRTSIPSRDVFNQAAFYLTPLCVYSSLSGGFNKLIVIQKTGNCGEFAEATRLLIHDLVKVPARVTTFEGVDHAFPEIYLENRWWVFDRIYTTSKYPVEANQYSNYLKGTRLEECIADLKAKDGGESVLLEHGFKPINLIITAILDMTTNRSDDVPVSGAEVEIFAPINHYDPLIAKGKTNESGKFSLILKSRKDYVVIVKIKEIFGIKKAVGVVYLDKNELVAPNKTVEVHLHKYE